jgi:hypothetical protein
MSPATFNTHEAMSVREMGVAKSIDATGNGVHLQIHRLSSQAGEVAKTII